MSERKVHNPSETPPHPVQLVFSTDLMQTKVHWGEILPPWKEMAKCSLIFNGQFLQMHTLGDSLPIKQVNKTIINFHKDKSSEQQRRRTV